MFAQSMFGSIARSAIHQTRRVAEPLAVALMMLTVSFVSPSNVQAQNNPAKIAKDNGEPLFVCVNPKGYSYYASAAETGWTEDAFTAVFGIYADDVVIVRKNEAPFSVVEDGAVITRLNNINRRSGGVLIAAWPSSNVLETYRIVPDGEKFKLFMTQSKNSPNNNGIDKVSSLVGSCVTGNKFNP